VKETARPLGGRRVLLTREHAQVASLAQMLRAQGAEPVPCPVITFAPPADWSPVDRCLEGLAGYDGFLFTSVNAVSFFFERLQQTGISPEPLRRAPCFSVGPATARALAARGVRVRALPDRYQAEGLVELLGDQDLRGKRFLFPRARSARELLTRYLEEQEAQVDLAVVYETRKAEENQRRLQEILATGSLDYITFTSTSTARYFAELAAPAPAARRSWTRVPAACIGEITARAARAQGFETVLTARESTLQGLVRILVEHGPTHPPARPDLNR